MKRTTYRRVSPLLLLGTLGCAALLGGFEEPELRLDHVVVRALTLSGGNLDLVLHVYNPNGFALRGTGLEVAFEADGSHLGDVAYDSEFQVQAGDTSVVTLPLQFEWSGVSGALRSAFQSGEVPYTVRGRALLETPLGRQSVPFTREGRVPVTRAIGASLGTPGT